jgi:transaldolase
MNDNSKGEWKVDALAVQLHEDGAKSFVKSWNDLMTVIDSKSNALKQAA